MCTGYNLVYMHIKLQMAVYCYSQIPGVVDLC